MIVRDARARKTPKVMPIGGSIVTQRQLILLVVLDDFHLARIICDRFLAVSHKVAEQKTIEG